MLFLVLGQIITEIFIFVSTCFIFRIILHLSCQDVVQQEAGKDHSYSLNQSLTLGARPALQLARSLCGTEAIVHMVKIPTTVSQSISVLAITL
jgi:hypothetical protein